jgi:aryl-alcohol dehydrogenase-like predicted oxidoreductase
MAEAMLERAELAPGLQICRVLNGMWQVAGGHGRVDAGLAVEEMAKYHRAGFTSWDLADIYGPAEEFVGQFRSALPPGDAEKMQALTKWVPDPQKITRNIAQVAVERSKRRMRVEAIDLVQFHWWDYNNPYYIDAIKFLSDLRDDGMIRHVGLTNFDTERMQIISDASLRIASNQVQYSIVDRRPEVKMADYCAASKVRLLTYGTVCGGLISERYLGRQEPNLPQLDTMSLRKYKRMIDEWGGWGLFQRLLSTLDAIAKKHGASIANVATRYILDKPAVAGVILGARLSITNHIDDNARVFGLRLDGDDVRSIEEVCASSNDLFERIGDCGDEYR